MPQPTRSDVHVDAVLTNISVAYMQSMDNFIAQQVFPVVPVDKQSDKYYTYTKDDWFRDDAQRRAPATESAGSGYDVSTTTYSCDVWAFHKDIPDQVRANADDPLNPDREATEFVTRTLMLRQEIQWVSDYFASSVWGTDSTPSSLWDDYANSDPIGDVETGKSGILSVTGFEANTLVLGYDVFRQLKHHPDIVDRVKYTSSETVTAEMLGRIFEIPRVLVAKAVKNTADEGATASYSFTHGKHALLCHTAMNPGLLTPSAGYIFAWRGVSGTLGETVGIDRIRMDTKKADRVEGEVAFDDKVVATDLGYFFDSVVS